MKLNNMKTIIIGFSRSKDINSPLSKIIRWVEKTPYSHVFIKVYNENFDRHIIYQASGLMVNFMSPTIFENHSVVIKEYKVDVTNETYVDIMQFAIDNAGVPYAIKELFGIAIVKLLKLFNINLNKNPFGDGKTTLKCSELGGYIIENFLDVDIKEDLDTISPLEIDQILSKYPDKFKLIRSE